MTIKNTNKQNLYIYCDGGARNNPGPAAYGFVVKDENRKNIFKKKGYIGKTTNNVAEYQAVIKALEWLNLYLSAISNQQLIINFFLDSQLVVKQLNGLYKVKNLNLQSKIIQIKGLENQIKQPIFYTFIRREKNKEADKLVNEALDQKLKIK